MSHLGDLAAALADDQLDHDERDRALAHLAGCGRCRREVEAQRRAKSALAALADPVPPHHLLGSLARLAEPGGPLPAGHRDRLGRRPPPAPVGAPPARRAGRPHGRRRVRPAVRVTALASVSAAAVTVGLVGLGAERPVEPAPAAVVPPLERFSLEHARATSSLPFVEPAVVIAPATVRTGAPAAAGAGRR